MRFVSLILLLTVALPPTLVSADELVLRNGGRLVGKLLSSRDSGGYLLQLPSGGKIRVQQASVRRVVRTSAVHAEYKQRSKSVAATSQAQWELSEWCRKNGLMDERRLHLKRVIAHHPEHKPARRALGYSRVGSRWVRAEEFFRHRGYVQFEGRWMLPQEIEHVKEKRAIESARVAWKGRIRRLRALLVSDNVRSHGRRQMFQDQLSSITDPMAVQPLTESLKKEIYRPIKMMLIQSLANIKTGPATRALVEQSLMDADEEVFHECLRYIVKRKTPTVVKVYIDHLKHPNNHVVNRAAIGLRRLEDSEAIGPLIDALVTTHVLVLKPRGGGSPDSIATSFVNPGKNPNSSTVNPPLGGTGMTAGNRTKVIPQRVRNSDVLSALVGLSRGLNFGYNQIAWRNWDTTRIRRLEASKSLRK